MATYQDNKWDIWIKAALAGDQDAYRDLLTALRPWLTAYFRKRIHTNAVDDLVQETLMALHSKRHTYNPAYPFMPWLSAVARHRWIDHMRKTLRHIELQLDDAFQDPSSAREEAARHDVQALLKKIPPAQAQVIEMVKLRDMSVADVAAQTGHSASSVKVMVHRGMKRMMTVVQEDSDA